MIDVGCGTGLSTEPLTSFARVVVGVDVSEEMLRARVRGGCACYVGARAEQLPFRDGTFELATIASAVHWFGSKAIVEIGRVLKPSAWLVVYDVRFRGEMLGDGAFAGWMRDECGPRYVSVSKNELTPEKVASIGFGLGWGEELRFDVPMTLEALVAYLMTHSERIAAVREGRETEAQQEEYLSEALRPFFAAVERRQLGFSIRVKAFAR